MPQLSNTQKVAALALLYFALGLAGALRHELWLDEAHHWLLARDSESFGELLTHTRLEGHPVFWNLLLFVLTRFTTNPFAMQLLHLAIATGTVLVFLKKAPFSFKFKTLFVLGYFMLFEYNLIARNYMLGVLFLFLCCGLYQKRDNQFTLLCFYLALALNVHLMFSVVAIAFFVLLFLEQTDGNGGFFKKRFLKGYAVFSIGCLLLALQLFSTDSDWLLQQYEKMTFTDRIGKGFIAFLKGIWALPDFRTIHFWNSNLLINLSRPFAIAMALVSYALPFILFGRKRKLLFFVCLAMAGVQLIFFVTQRGAMRFYGINYFILLFGLWLDAYLPPKVADEGLKNKAGVSNAVLVYSLLIVHFCSGVVAYTVDLRYPFTSAQDTVEFLKANKLVQKRILTFSCDGTVLSAYLEKKVYFLAEQSEQSYCNWQSAMAKTFSKAEVLKALTAHRFGAESEIFVSAYPLIELKQGQWQPLYGKLRIRQLRHWNNAILPNTCSYVYEVAPLKN